MSKPIAFAREGDDDYGYSYLVRDASDTRDIKGDDSTARLYTTYDHQLGDEKWIQDIIKFSYGDWQLYSGPAPKGLDEAWGAMEEAKKKSEGMNSKPMAFAHDGIKYMVRDASDTTDVKAEGAMAWIYRPKEKRLDQYALIQVHVKFGWDWQPYDGPAPEGLAEAWAAMKEERKKNEGKGAVI
jgi:hypothetical protein